ncbi:MAG: IS30 family transposase [Kiritimatiellales bacterium]
MNGDAENRRPQLAAFLVEQITVKRCSPAVAAYRMKDEPYAVCMKTIYNLMDHGRVPGVSHESLWEKRRRKRRYRPVQRIRKRAVTPGHSITDRPPAVETRTEFGHWEIDLIVSGKGALLSLTERKTRRLILRKLRTRSQAAVIGVLNDIGRQTGAEAFRCIFKSITSDNGGELLDYAGMERSVVTGKRTHRYYAHPYSAWERGGNENTNRFIRRFIPKGRRLGRISRKLLHEIETWINTYPRKILNFETAEERFNQEIAA